MATATLLDSGAAGYSGTGVASITTASISPGANCLLVWMCVVMQDDGGFGTSYQPGTLSSSASGPDVWSAGYSANTATNFGPESGCQYVQIGGSDPGAFTITWVHSAGGGGGPGSYCYAVWKVTGYDTGAPIVGGGAQAAQSGDGAVTLTMNATPASGDITLAITGADVDTGGGATFSGSNGTWTEAVDFSTTNWGGNTGQRTGYSSGATVVWSDVHTGTGTGYLSGQTAITVKSSGAAAATSDPPSRPINRLIHNLVR